MDGSLVLGPAIAPFRPARHRGVEARLPQQIVALLDRREALTAGGSA